MVMWGPTQNLGLIGSAVLTDKQSIYINVTILKCFQADEELF